MHIPDGFLSPPVFGSAWLFSAVALSVVVRKTRSALQDKTVPLMGVMAAFIFAAQMLNFPVLAGTSGHLLGGVLAAICVGPQAACVILTLVLAVQCLIFQDGGLTALGANIFNMAFVGTFVGYGVYGAIRKISGGRHILAAVFISSWVSVVLASSACAFELALSGASSLGIVLPAMVLVHMAIGVGEALITVSVVRFLCKVRPDLLYNLKPGSS